MRIYIYWFHLLILWFFKSCQFYNFKLRQYFISRVIYYSLRLYCSVITNQHTNYRCQTYSFKHTVLYGITIDAHKQKKIENIYTNSSFQHVIHYTQIRRLNIELRTPYHTIPHHTVAINEWTSFFTAMWYRR